MAGLFKKKSQGWITLGGNKETAEEVKEEAAQLEQPQKPTTIVCPACGKEIDSKEAKKNKYVCMSVAAIFVSVPKTESVWWLTKRVLSHGLKT